MLLGDAALYRHDRQDFWQWQGAGRAAGEQTQFLSLADHPGDDLGRLWVVSRPEVEQPSVDDGLGGSPDDRRV